MCCQCSRGVVEDELHFVTGCSRFAEERLALFDKIKDISLGKWKLNELSPQKQFHFLMQGSGDRFEADIFAIFQGTLIRLYKRRI